MNSALKLATAAGLMAIALQAKAIMIVAPGDALDGTDVGMVDTYVGEITQADLNSGYPGGDAGEIAWVNDETDESYASLNKEEPVPWYNTDTAGVIAFQLTEEFEYFLIKNAQLRVLLWNVDNLGFGVVDLASINGNINLGDDMQISHVSGFGEAGTVRVPEPASLTLLGGVLIGLATLRRRRRSLT
jgi:PEP-CTERM motif